LYDCWLIFARQQLLNSQQPTAAALLMAMSSQNINGNNNAMWQGTSCSEVLLQYIFHLLLIAKHKKVHIHLCPGFQIFVIIIT
jgi:hypothetical protein